MGSSNRSALLRWSSRRRRSSYAIGFEMRLPLWADAPVNLTSQHAVGWYWLTCNLELAGSDTRGGGEYGICQLQRRDQPLTGHRQRSTTLGCVARFQRRSCGRRYLSTGYALDAGRTAAGGQCSGHDGSNPRYRLLHAVLPICSIAHIDSLREARHSLHFLGSITSQIRVPISRPHTPTVTELVQH